MTLTWTLLFILIIALVIYVRVVSDTDPGEFTRILPVAHWLPVTDKDNLRPGFTHGENTVVARGQIVSLVHPEDGTLTFRRVTSAGSVSFKPGTRYHHVTWRGMVLPWAHNTNDVVMSHRPMDSCKWQSKSPIHLPFYVTQGTSDAQKGRCWILRSPDSDTTLALSGVVYFQMSVHGVAQTAKVHGMLEFDIHSVTDLGVQGSDQVSINLFATEADKHNFTSSLNAGTLNVTASYGPTFTFVMPTARVVVTGVSGVTGTLVPTTVGSVSGVRVQLDKTYNQIRTLLSVQGTQCIVTVC